MDAILLLLEPEYFRCSLTNWCNSFMLNGLRIFKRDSTIIVLYRLDNSNIDPALFKFIAVLHYYYDIHVFSIG